MDSQKQSQQAGLIPFTAGKSGNPGGKPAGARNRLTTRFLHELADDFETHGKAAIVACREKDPAAYIKAVAALLPKEVTITRPLEEIADDELTAAITYLRSRVAEGAGAGSVREGESQSVN